MGDAESGLKLNILCEYFHRYWGKKTIIILDEYDTPYTGGISSWILE